MDRRHALALALVALLAGLAGCADTTGSISMTPVDDDALAERGSQPLPGTDGGPAVPQSDVVRRAIVDGSASVAAPDPPVRAGSERPYRHEGRYYALNQTVVGTQPGYTAGIEIDFNGSVDGAVVDYADLPAVDRSRVDVLLAGPRERTESGYDFGIGASYSETEADNSVLVPDQQYDAVRYQGETYPIRVVEVSETTLDVYRYEATVVAESEAAFAEHLRSTYAFALTDLSEAEREVVDAALEDTYRPDAEGDDGFASLVDRFRERRGIEESDFGGTWLVTYEGQLYWTSVEYGPYARGTGTGEEVTAPSVTPPG